MSEVPVVCVSQTDDVDERIAFLEAGADDVMAKPFDGRELEARVEALLLRFQRSGGLDPDLLGRRPDDGHGPAGTIAVFSPKGGVGHDDHRHQHRGVRGPAPSRQGGPRRPRPPVRRRLEPPQPRDRAAPSPTSSATRSRCASRRSCGPTPSATTPGSTSSRRRARPRAPTWSPRSTSRGSSRTCWRATTRSSSMPAPVLDERSMTALEAAEAVMLPVYPEIAALRAVHNLHRLLQRRRLDHAEVDLHPQQRVREGHPQAARRRERPRLEGGGGAAVRPVPLPQGGQRGDPDGHRGAEVGGRGSAQQAEHERLRRGRLQRPGRRQRAPPGRFGIRRRA